MRTTGLVCLLAVVTGLVGLAESQPEFAWPDVWTTVPGARGGGVLGERLGLWREHRLWLEPSNLEGEPLSVAIQRSDTRLIPYYLAGSRGAGVRTFFPARQTRGSDLESIACPRQVSPVSAIRRALVMMISHESLEAPAVDAVTMQGLMDQVRELFAAASGGRFELESVVLPEPVFLPGEYSDYSITRTQELSAVASQEVLKRNHGQWDPEAFDVLIYFYPTDTNTEPFGMSWKTTSGSRYTPPVVNLGFGMRIRPETIAHEIGHAFFQFGHATSADPKTGEVIQSTGDPYDLMGYGLNQNLEAPPHMGFTYRYYWGWTSDEEITVVAEPGTARLDPGRALLVPTDKDSLLWLEIITAEQAYKEEAGGLLIRIDKTNQHNIYHRTVDLTPETDFQADMHLAPGQSIVVEGRRITYVESIENENSGPPCAEIRIEGSGLLERDW